jgi:Protein of unknown function (DUF3300)
MELSMKKILITLSVAFLVLGYAPWWAEGADTYSQGNGYAPYTPEELDELLAPIALYPDPLLAQVLPAATFADQIDEAARYVRQYGKSARIDDQLWDVSVRSVAHYPDVLYMMDQKYDWTVSVGQAFADQEQDVMDSIQRLRAEARALGNLVSSSQQQVVVEDGSISIIPAEPELIFVPFYDPVVVYLDPPPMYGFITFSVGFTIGVWLNRDCDWRGHRIFYHGWRGGGWIGRSRPHLRIRNAFYVNDRFAVVNVNKSVSRRIAGGYRDELRRKSLNRGERTGRAAVPLPGVKEPGRGEARTEPLRPAVSGERRQAPPATTDVYRGRDVQKAQPASRTGYGGYGNSRDASQYRERGQTSRDTMRQIQHSAPAAPAAPAVHQSPPAYRGGGGGRQR